MRAPIVALVVALAATTLTVVSCKPAEAKLDAELVEALKRDYLAAKSQSASKWLSYQDKVYIYLYRGGGEPNSRVAANAIQSTLANTNTNSPYPENADDWHLVEGAKQRLEADSAQARVVLFDNQYGVKLNYVTLDQVKQRTENIVQALGVPATIFISIHKDKFRKPQTGMWSLFEAAFNGDVKVDKSQSYYSGFASGGDRYSDHDSKFAERVGLPFRTV